jgi:Fe2+ transport system protein B
VAAVATIRREMNSRRWTAVCLAWQIAAAYAVSVAVYQIARLLM